VRLGRVFLGWGFIFPFLAFAVPLLVRLVPEVLMGQYLVGFDTMAHVVPTSLLWLGGGLDVWRFVATAPLFYLVVVFFVSAGAPLFLVLKVVGPVLHGFLGLAIYGYARRGLVWSCEKSVFVAFLGTLFFVALRVSWDLLRNELALVFFFVVLMLLSEWGRHVFSWWRSLMFCLAVLAVVLSHQLVAVVMFGVVLFVVVYGFFRGRFVGCLVLGGFCLPGVMLFFLGVFLSHVVSEFRLIFGFPELGDGWLRLFGFSSYPALLAGELGFFLYCFLTLLPLVVLGVWRLGSFELRSWVVVVFLVCLVPFASPSNLRWVLLLVYPFAFFVVESFGVLGGLRWRRFGVWVRRGALFYVVFLTVFLSCGFMFWSAETPFGYFDGAGCNGFIYHLPSSMLQNTVSLGDCGDVVNALGWLGDKLGEGKVLICHRAFYGWALSVLGSRQVVLYEYNDAVQAAKSALLEGYGGVYLIWWIRGEGWYGQPSVASVFSEVYRSGRIALYEYVGGGV